MSHKFNVVRDEKDVEKKPQIQVIATNDKCEKKSVQ
jgi:hypothetical protein